jgi:hypothetical protein
MQCWQGLHQLPQVTTASLQGKDQSLGLGLELVTLQKWVEKELAFSAFK